MVANNTEKIQRRGVTFELGLNRSDVINFQLTTASLKWRLGAWSIWGLPLLAASS